ncbi:MAG: aminotransferase DegT, partial [Pseudomonadota bacterium]
MQFIDLAAQRARLGVELEQAVNSVVQSGRYILGPEVAEFEKRLG